MLAELLSILIIVFVASVVMRLAGFGFGLVALSTMPYFVAVRTALGISVTYGIAFGLFTLAWDRSYIRRSTLQPLLTGVILGTPIGVYYIGHVSDAIYRRSLGLMLIASVLCFALKVPLTFHHTFWGYLFGFTSGIMGGAFTMPAVSIVVYTLGRRLDKYEARSTVNAVLLVAHVLTALLYSTLGGVLGTAEFIRAIVASPLAVVGGLIGGTLLRRIDQAAFRRVLLILLAVSGVVMVVR